MSEITFSPFLPPAVLIAAAVIGLCAVAIGLVRRARGWAFRALFLSIILTALAHPQIVSIDSEPLDDIVLLAVDRTASARLSGRAEAIEAARAALVERLEALGDIEIEEFAIDDDPNEGSALFGRLRETLADIDRTRLGAVIALTDGIIHDIPADPAKLESNAPFHALLAGDPDEIDRKLEIVRAPTFGLLGEPLAIVLRVDDFPQSAADDTVQVTLKKDGTVLDRLALRPGEETAVPVELEKAGHSVIEAEAAPLDGEITLLNNRATVTINGIRDRLRVLLISGQPYPGLRVWRNLLKADPAVDLVHFTILRPPEKQDGTPIRELALIAFPSRELFEEKLDEFDLIIFDRYARRGLLPLVYLDNVARYVEAGGAVLEAAGPEFAASSSLFRTPLARILPGRPSGEVIERGFRPAVTDTGALHPVTADLEGADDWGRWFRQIDVESVHGHTLMTGVSDRPLLILDRVGEGRVAQLLSDHAWLWARGVEGGGPQAPLLRRLVHWLMKEPELEEEALSARADGDGLLIERRSLDAEGPTLAVTVTRPSGATGQLLLEAGEDGLFRATLEADEDGIYRFEDGDLVAYASPRRLSRIELTDLRAQAGRLDPVITATSGSARWLSGNGIPDFRRVAEGRATAGRGWIGIRERGAAKVTGATQTALLPGWLALVLAMATICAAWWREGRS
ncbi:MAG: hypothetical protein KDF64_07555 [Geminicoccaceae bacterium]|nr:hypothetical protein [Geminicoccaceae bacterium]